MKVYRTRWKCQISSAKSGLLFFFGGGGVGGGGGGVGGRGVSMLFPVCIALT